MNNLLLMMYWDILIAVAGAISQNAAALGLMVPGCPEQIGLPNGVVVANGIPYFRAVVLRRNGDTKSRLELGKAIQDALDQYCYGNFCDRLYLLRVEQLPGNYVGLTLTWGAW